jgi:phosphoserine phosphatase RsbU/P
MTVNFYREEQVSGDEVFRLSCRNTNHKQELKGLLNFMRIQPKSLQQRTLLYAILPTFILLITLSLIGFLLARNVLIDQWGETIISKLGRSADLIEAQLIEPKKLLMLLQNDDNSLVNRQLINTIADQIGEFDIVDDVIVDWPERAATKGPWAADYEVLPDHGKQRFQLRRFDIGSPRYDERVKNRTISLISEFKGMDDEIVGTIEVIISFDDLLDHIVNAPWWTTNKAYLLDGSHNVLITTGDKTDLEDNYPMRRYGTVNDLEQATIRAIESKNSGTVLGPGIPPEEISGFYRLDQVPWTLVVTAPGKKVLEPIITLLRYYIISLALCIGLILIFMRMSMSRVTEGIKQVSRASNDLASGNFGPPLEVITRDEIGELTENFNKMSGQLKQRLELKKNIDLAREVQQSLLPQKGLKVNGIDISGAAIYCDETGGDYFDILEFGQRNDKIGIVVGDVVGHGVGAALLMTTVRALVRSSFQQSGTIEEMMDNVNRLLYQDTVASGSFVTLFYLEIDRKAKSLRWVRAGHDPAFVINCRTNEYSELRGEGVALGVDLDYKFTCNELLLSEDPQAILLCSDGIFEATNEAGEPFGKQRVYELLQGVTKLESEKAVNRIIGEIQSFVKAAPINDDITIVFLRIS